MEKGAENNLAGIHQQNHWSAITKQFRTAEAYRDVCLCEELPFHFTGNSTGIKVSRIQL